MIQLHYRYKGYPVHNMDGNIHIQQEIGLRTDEPSLDDFQKSFAFLITQMIEQKKLKINLEAELKFLLPFFAEVCNKFQFEEGKTIHGGILTKEGKDIYTVAKRVFLHMVQYIEVPDLNEDDNF